MEERRRLVSRVRKILASQALLWLSGSINRSEPSGPALEFNKDGQRMSVKTPGRAPVNGRCSDE
jgi:hypothetical protein